MRRFWAQPLRRQLFIAILLLLVPVLAAAVWSAFATFRERAEDLRAQSHALALTTAAWVDRDLETIDRMAQAIGGLDEIRNADPAAGALLRQAVNARPT